MQSTNTNVYNVHEVTSHHCEMSHNNTNYKPQGIIGSIPENLQMTNNILIDDISSMIKTIKDSNDCSALTQKLLNIKKIIQPIIDSSNNYPMNNKPTIEEIEEETMSNNSSLNSSESFEQILDRELDLALNLTPKKTSTRKLIPSISLKYLEECKTRYATVTFDHDQSIAPTKEYVRTFLTNIIKQISKEKVPEMCNLEDIVKTISEGLPVTIEKDNFYNYTAEYLIAKSSSHYYYDMMAAAILIKRLHSITSNSFLETAKFLQDNTDKNNDRMPILSDEIYNIIVDNHEKLQAAIDYNRDYLFDFFGIKTLERSYLYKLHFTKFKIIESPQHMWMRVSLGIHGNDIDAAIETYHLLSNKFFTHATPTLFNSGTKNAQMSSCFLQSMSDNIESIFSAVNDIAFTSKWSGGIGVHISSLRARGSLIRGTNGLASGIIPLCILLNKLAKYINQGGKRNGSIAVYLEPSHPDIFDFCDLRKNTGNDDNRARDLFLALWVPSLFIKRVKEDGMWSLMCPDECQGLNLVHSEEYNKLYEKYENQKKYTKQVRARDLWKHILEAQSETGFPYILYKDNANAKSNQKNLGTIRSSNLCAEIIQYSDENETAVCNLASICLPMYVKRGQAKMTFDHKQLMKVVRVIVRNLDKIIDRNYYPTIKTKRSNLRHRPMGIGVQGLADVYNIMGFGYDSKEASRLNKEIFETIYFACIDESKELAKKYGHYQSFAGSPASNGQLQFHMWGVETNDLLMNYQWDHLVEEVKKYGLRNSLLTALMPTASTSQIMGNSECIEPYMSNIFKRSTLAGEFIVVNKNLMKELQNLNLWDDDMRKLLIIENGSVQNINSIPQHIKDIYKTAFEIKQMYLVKQSADRGIFVDQSQSFNLFMAEPNFDILTAALIHGHDLGNKTGMYYYRSQAAVNPISFGIDIEDIKRLTGKNDVLDMITDSYNIRANEINQSPQYKTDNSKENKFITKKQSDSCANDEIIINHSGSNDSKRKQTNESLIDIIFNNDKKQKILNVQSDFNRGDQKSSPGDSLTRLNNSTLGNMQTKSNTFCKWKPGVKLEDCLSCGS